MDERRTSAALRALWAVFLSSTAVWVALTIVTLFFRNSFAGPFGVGTGSDASGWQEAVFKALAAAHVVALGGLAIIAARWFWAHTPGGKTSHDPPQ